MAIDLISASQNLQTAKPVDITKQKSLKSEVSKPAVKNFAVELRKIAKPGDSGTKIASHKDEGSKSEKSQINAEIWARIFVDTMKDPLSEEKGVFEDSFMATERGDFEQKALFELAKKTFTNLLTED